MRDRARIIEDIRARREWRKAVTGRNPPRRKLPAQLQPDAIRLQYFREIRDFLKTARGLVQSVLVPALPSFVNEAKEERGDRLDSASGRAQKLIDQIANEFGKQVSTKEMSDLAFKIGNRTAGFQKEQLYKQIRAAVGVDVLGREPNLVPRVEQFTVENVALIKSVPQRYFSDIEKVLTRRISDGDRWEDIATELEDRYGVAESSAKLIARDQVGKFFGDLNEARQTALGIDSYIWQTANDNRVRDEHAALQGEQFDWSDPPEDGHPGEPVNCRCWPEPVLDDILDAL